MTDYLYWKTKMCLAKTLRLASTWLSLFTEVLKMKSASPLHKHTILRTAYRLCEPLLKKTCKILLTQASAHARLIVFGKQKCASQRRCAWQAHDFRYLLSIGNEKSQSLAQTYCPGHVVPSLRAVKKRTCKILLTQAKQSHSNV